MRNLVDASGCRVAEAAGSSLTGRLLADCVSHEVEIGVEPLAPLPRIAGLTYGRWFDLFDSVDERGSDVRWDGRLVVARRHGRIAGILPTFRCRTARVADAAFAGALQQLEVDPDGRRHLFVGCSANLSGGALVKRHHDRWLDAVVLAALYRSAAGLARGEGLLPSACFVPDEQVAIASLSIGPLAANCLGAVNSVIELGRARTVDQFLSALAKRDRQTLRADMRRSVDCALTVERSEALGDDLLAEAADLISLVKQRNGTPEHPRLVLRRIVNWRRRSEGHAGALICRDPHGTVLGICLIRLEECELRLFEIGLADGPLRHQTYVEMAFGAALRCAISEGMDRMVLGTGHPLVKRSRGAVQTLSWHLSGHNVADS
jgi:hypothetical protein